MSDARRKADPSKLSIARKYIVETKAGNITYATYLNAHGGVMLYKRHRKKGAHPIHRLFSFTFSHHTTLNYFKKNLYEA